MARPTKLDDAAWEAIEDYLENYISHGDVVPSVVGLADCLGVVERTLYNWGESDERFLQTLALIKQRQHKVLMSKGLSGDFNSNIAKLMLHNHGYSDKAQQEISGPAGGPVVIEREFVAPKQQSSDS